MVFKFRKIKAEIERLIALKESQVTNMRLRGLLSFIDTLEQEPTLPSTLEEAAKYHRAHGLYGGDINLAMEDSFKKGAEWMARQMNNNQTTILYGVQGQ